MFKDRLLEKHMSQIGIVEARRRLSERVGRAALGEEFVVTRRGESMARPVPTELANARMQGLGLPDLVRRSRVEHTLGGDATIRAQIDEGRR